MRVALVAVAFAACGPRPAPTPAPTKPAATAPTLVVVARGEPAQQLVEGVRLAADGAADVVVVDSAGDEEEWHAELLGVVHDRHVVAVIGDIDAESSGNLILWFRDFSDLPVISPVPPPTSTKVFSLQLTDDVEGELAAEFALGESWTRSVTVVAMGVRYLGLAFEFDFVYSTRGASVGRFSFYPDTPVFGRQLAAIEQAAPDVVYLACDGATSIALLTEAKARGMTMPKMLGPSAWQDTPVDTDPIARGVFHMARFAPDDPQSKTFVLAFEDRFGHPPDAFAAGGHDAAVVALEAFERHIAPADLTYVDEPLAMGSLAFRRGEPPRFESIPVVQVTESGPTFVKRVGHD